MHQLLVFARPWPQKLQLYCLHDCHNDKVQSNPARQQPNQNLKQLFSWYAPALRHMAFQANWNHNCTCSRTLSLICWEQTLCNHALSQLYQLIHMRVSERWIDAIINTMNPSRYAKSVITQSLTTRSIWPFDITLFFFFIFFILLPWTDWWDTGL